MTADTPHPDEPFADRRQPVVPSGDAPPADLRRRHAGLTYGSRGWCPVRTGPAGRASADRTVRRMARAGAAAAPWWLLSRGAHRFGHGDGDHGAADGHGDGNDRAGDDASGVLSAVRQRAREVHERLAHEHGVFAVEFVGSTGGGKTALAERLVDRWDGRVGVVCGDVAGEDDARRYREHGVPVENVTTGKDCHLDPARVDDALDAFDLDALDTLVVENVGNMVCPADFPLGTSVRVLVVSPTEGDDVVRKHPLLFQAVDAAVVNKVDIADAVGADVDRMVDDAREVAPGLSVVRTSAETGRGLDDLAALLDRERDHAHGHQHA